MADRITKTLLLDSLRELLCVANHGGTLVSANERLGELTGQSPAELESSPITELTPFVVAGFADLRAGIDTLLRDDLTERRIDITMGRPAGTPVDTRTLAEARLTRLTHVALLSPQTSAGQEAAPVF